MVGTTEKINQQDTDRTIKMIMFSIFCIIYIGIQLT